MSTRRDYPRCEECRRRFGGWEAYRVAHTTRGRCKTVRELRRNRLHRRDDGIWVQGPPEGGYRQLRLFRLGRPGEPRSVVYLRLATTIWPTLENGSGTGATTNQRGSQDALPSIREAA